MKKLFDIGSISIWVDEKGNYKCHLEGSYVISVSKDEDDMKSLSIKVAEPVAYYVRGTMNNWEAKEEYKLVVDEQNKTASIVVDIREEDEFKIASSFPDWSYQFGADYKGEIVRNNVVSQNIKRPTGTYKITILNVCSVNNAICKIEPITA